MVSDKGKPAGSVNLSKPSADVACDSDNRPLRPLSRPGGRSEAPGPEDDGSGEDSSSDQDDASNSSGDGSSCSDEDDSEDSERIGFGVAHDQGSGRGHRGESPASEPDIQCVGEESVEPPSSPPLAANSASSPAALVPARMG